MGDLILGIVAVVVLLFLFILLLKVFKTPIKWVFKLFLNALSGFIALWVLNLFGGIVGLHIDVTWFSAIVVGVLGLPGVVLLLILQYFMV